MKNTQKSQKLLSPGQNYHTKTLPKEEVLQLSNSRTLILICI